MVNGLHLYSAFIQSAVQFMPLIHTFTHTHTHGDWLHMQGTNRLVCCHWGQGVLLRVTSTRTGWDRTGNPLTAGRLLLPPEPYRPQNVCRRFSLRPSPWPPPHKIQTLLFSPPPFPRSPQHSVLSFLHSIQEALQLSGSLGVHKLLPDTGVQAPGELIAGVKETYVN